VPKVWHEVLFHLLKGICLLSKQNRVINRVCPVLKALFSKIIVNKEKKGL
jgi:hypothetical protein